jgi:NADPH2 dehydrogenase
MKSAFSDDMNYPSPLTGLGIREVIADFKAAAENAILAGFDGVEIHGANGYLIDQFLQDVSNKRTDKWGGGIENRSRLAVEVTRAVAKTIGNEHTAIRLSPWGRYQGMRMEDPTLQFSDVARRLAELELAYLQICESDAKDKEESIGWLLQAYDNGSCQIDVP